MTQLSITKITQPLLNFNLINLDSHENLNLICKKSKHTRCKIFFYIRANSGLLLIFLLIPVERSGADFSLICRAIGTFS